MRLLNSVLFTVVVIVSTQTLAAVTLQKLAMDGDHEPTTNLTYKLGSYAWGGGGKLLLDVTLSGSGVTTANDRGWLYGGASPSLLYREGQPLPGVAGQTISFVDGSVGPTGWYGARITNNGATSFSTVIGDGTTSSIVARANDPAPGTTSTMSTAWPSAVISDTQYALLAYLPKPVGASSYPMAYYRTRSTDGSLQLMTLSGTVMPGLAPENTGLMITTAQYTAKNAMWTLAYNSPNYPYASNQFGLFMSRDTGSTLVVKEGDPQPVSPPCGAALPRAMWLGDDGSYVVVSGFLDSGNYNYGTGIYSGNESTYTLRRLPSQVFVDQPGRFDTGVSAFDSNRAGKIVIAGSVSTSGWAQTYKIIGVGNADSGFKTVAIQGGTAPELTAVTFSSFDMPSSGSSDWISEQGDIAFRSTLSGTGVTSSNDVALWFYDHTNSTVRLLAREGDTLTVDGVARTIGTLGSGASFFDAGGSFVFGMTFSDGTRGYFAAQVPEPGTGLVFGGIAAFITTARRSRRRH